MYQGITRVTVTAPAESDSSLRLLLSYRVPMSSVEYLFADSFYIADRAARKQGWVPRGRAEWHKPDGTVVCFICLEEHLAAVPANMTVYVVGEEPEGARRYKCKLIKLAR
jgi:hypothetical protein